MSGAPKSSYSLRAALPLAWMRDAGWREVLYVFAYPIKTWRCRLFGHKWGPEKSGYEIGIRTDSWRECERSGCEGYWETYHYLAKEGEQRVFG